MSTKVPAYRLAQRSIKRYIEEHKLKPGDLLPPESQLAKDMGMSRLSMREGVKSLEAVGILEARQGEGVFVKGFTFDSIFENLPYSFAADGKSLRDLLQVRTALEEGMMPVVVKNTTAIQLAHLETLAQAMLEKARLGITFEDEDREFHQTLYGPLENTFLNRLVDLFWEVFHRLNGSAGVPHWKMEQTASDHLKVVEALRAGDAPQARAAIHQHFWQINERLSSPLAPQPIITDVELPNPASTPY